VLQDAVVRTVKSVVVVVVGLSLERDDSLALFPTSFNGPQSKKSYTRYRLAIARTRVSKSSLRIGVSYR
jgi:hypothetical protein